jgi:hypothetical protein
MPAKADTKFLGRFWLKRCGPSHRRGPNASAVLKNFVRRPKKTFSTLSAQIGGQRIGRAFPLCPGISDINLFRYCQGVIDLDAEVADRAFDLGVSEQELHSP